MLGYMNNIVIYNEILEWYHGIKWDVVIYIDRYEWWSGIKWEMSMMLWYIMRCVDDIMRYMNDIVIYIKI